MEAINEDISDFIDTFKNSLLEKCGNIVGMYCSCWFVVKIPSWSPYTPPITTISASSIVAHIPFL
jgi:hypothetical protein